MGKQIFDHDEGILMMKNYSSLMMKDSKFRENVMLNGGGPTGPGGTPFVQYLIKNNKYKISQEQKKRKKNMEEVEETGSMTKAKG
jgi:hypothetical protein